jgi:hypothetical protein
MALDPGMPFAFLEADPADLITLNHRVPGSSPGAPTKLFKYLALKIEGFSRVCDAIGVISGVTPSPVTLCSVIAPMDDVMRYVEYL